MKNARKNPVITLSNPSQTPLKTPILGLILVGGLSSRMGQDKATLEYHKTSQLQYLTELLAPFVEKVYISARKEQLDSNYLKNKDNIIVDHYSCPSPLNGIVSAMRFFLKKSWLVVAVDMPNIDANSLKILINNRDSESVATCFAMPRKGGAEPLCAIWEGDAFSQLETLISEKTEHICPFQTLKNIGAHIIENAILPDILSNINTPEEREKWFKNQ